MPIPQTDKKTKGYDKYELILASLLDFNEMKRCGWYMKLILILFHVVGFLEFF